MCRHLQIPRHLMVAAAVLALSACEEETIASPIPGNYDPIAVRSIPRQGVKPGEKVTLGVSRYFADPEGMSLTFSARSMDGGVARAALVGGELTVTGISGGRTEVVVNARDPHGGSLDLPVAVMVTNEPDRVALEALYEAMGGRGWTYAQNWLTDAPLGDWHGVEVDSLGGVIGLYLIQNNLQGSLPPEIGNLTSLMTLNLSSSWYTDEPSQVLSSPPGDPTASLPTAPSDPWTCLYWYIYSDTRAFASDRGNAPYIPNRLTGEIPLELGELANLRILDLSGKGFHTSGLEGRIPPELGKLTELLELDLSNNVLTGALPPQLSQLAKLTKLDLSVNDIDGTIPVTLGNLVDLRILALNDNLLSGPIPEQLGGLTNLDLLHLDGNMLSGAIPPELGALANLSKLGLARNNLTAVPQELGKLARLQCLWLQGNKIERVPPELGALGRLLLLQVSFNRIANVPVEISLLPRLQHLSIQNNQVATLPPEIGRLGSLELLNVADNELTEIPTELGKLSNLLHLDMSGNRLAAVPPSLGGLHKLQILEMDSIGASDIPAELGNLRSLIHLSVAGNALTKLPNGVPGKLTRLGHLNLRGNALGQVPAGILEARFDELAILDLGDNRISEPLPYALADSLPGLWKIMLDGNAGACVPGVPKFEIVTRGDERKYEWCNEADVTALRGLYSTAGGSGWTKNIGWLEGHFVGTWDGVQVDSLGRVTELDLSGNGLMGRLGAGIANLGVLKKLRLTQNPGLSGRLPETIAELSKLRLLDYSGTGLCTPTGGKVETWIGSLEMHVGAGLECEPFADREVLEILHHAVWGVMGGEGQWEKWLSERPIGEWLGVDTDSLGRVVSISLAGQWSNTCPSTICGTPGEIPADLTQLENIEQLALVGLGLTGGIPKGLGSLPSLRIVNLGRNRLTGSIPSTLSELAELRHLDLSENMLNGKIPTTLGNLRNLTRLDLSENKLYSGKIPSELGDLENLEVLDLHSNGLTGAIPTKLGKLRKLTILNLGSNRLVGQIPAALGSLTELAIMDLSKNELSGRVPEILEGNGNVRIMDLSQNELSGPVPEGMGNLERLQLLDVSKNRAVTGPVPQSFVGLTQMQVLRTDGTRLCAPENPAFLRWLASVYIERVPRCVGVMAYVTQTVQTRSFGPVPVVAGREALLRVFLTADKLGVQFPSVRARLYLDDQQVQVVEIDATSHEVPVGGAVEGRLSYSANARIPAHLVRPGLEVVVEVDPEGVLDPSEGVVQRIPTMGRMAVDVWEMPILDLTVIPFQLGADSSNIVVADGMANDPDNHEMLRYAVDLLPIGGIQVTAHAPVITTTNDTYSMFSKALAIRRMEGGTGYYLGLLPAIAQLSGASGLAGGRVIVSVAWPTTIAHEMGHSFGLLHAPCGSPAGVDQYYPYQDGRIGSWGYAFRDLVVRNEGFLEHEMVSPATPDIMSYCGPGWISDYHFKRAVRHRTTSEVGSALVLEAAKSLLIWGGKDPAGELFLEPAFVVDAPPALPSEGGRYVLSGRDADGERLFSLSFAMPEVADAEASASSFAWVVPVDASWADRLSSLKLEGPGGAAMLDGTRDMPMSIYRDLGTGQVRAIIREDVPQADSALEWLMVQDEDVEISRSRGLPPREAWRR